MSKKPITYYGCDYGNELIRDICTSFGDYLQDMPSCDRVWLIARLAIAYLHRMAPEFAIIGDSEEIVDRLDELPDDQLAALIQALAN